MLPRRHGIEGRSMKMNGLLRIRGRLIASFCIIGLILAAVCGTVYVQKQKLAASINQITQLYVPATVVVSQLTKNIHLSMADTRGVVLTGGAEFKAQRAATWKALADATARLDEVAASFPNQQDRATWVDIRAQLGQLKTIQEEIERTVGTAEALPATQMVNTQLAPRLQKHFAEATALMEAETSRSDGTALHLRYMADLRANTASAGSALRAFLVAADPAAKKAFEDAWANATRGLEQLKRAGDDMTSEQRERLPPIETLRAEMREQVDKIMAIRQTDAWNIPLQQLTRTAAPVADRLAKLLEGGGVGLLDRQIDQLKSGANDAQQNTEAMFAIVFAMLVFSMIIAVVLAVLTSRSIVVPIAALSNAMASMSDGRLDLDISGRSRRDEIGEMARATEVFRKSMLENQGLQAQSAEKEAQAQAEKRRGIVELADTFEATIKSVVQSVHTAAVEMRASAEGLASTAEETTQRTTSVAASSDEALQNVQAVAAAADELSVSTREIGNQVTQSNHMISEAVAQANLSNEQVKGLTEAAQKIGDVVKIIADIAGQTNLLALNATIEAARAGDAGRGFAVVASEVKALAEQTARATDEIASQIKSIQEASEISAHSILGITNTIERISETAATIASAVEEQGASMQEIARSVQETARGTSEASSNIAGVKQAAQQTGSAAAQVLNAADQLAKNGDTLTHQVDAFLQQVRAA
jgi:methyl-accepting chemotaxis protein